jgi:hypothetical protein
MDKLERYLDQVCRGIAGPRSMRQHVRQELREHLNDAIDDHRAAGLSEADALDRALADFGAPSDVGGELQAIHGHRLMTVLLDKSLEWKERTMKAKWLWTTWTHVALGLVIALEVCFVTCILTFVTPKMKKIVADTGTTLEAIMPAGQSMLSLIEFIADATPVLLIVLAIGWGLFEWRARTENKTFIRLATMGTIATVLMAIVFMSAAVTAIPLALAAPRALKQQSPATQPTAAIANEPVRNNLAVAAVADHR